jgi:alpha-tubulin suppressor-like RCC1 family protein
VADPGVSGTATVTVVSAPSGDLLLGWGYNDYGSVGDGTQFVHRPSPVPVNIIQSARLIASGGSHNLAVAGNVLYAWGDNESGQLGDGTTITQLEPRVITLPTGIRADGLKAIACGWYHSLAITADNRVLAWGLNKDGQCGVTPDAPRLITTPRVVAGLANITQISGGTLHSLALDNSGRVWAWGSNFYGQLGNGTIENVKHTPAIVANLPAAQSVGAGGGHSVALLSDGTLRAWGWNFYGQLGDGLSGYTNDGQERRSGVPVVVRNAGGISQLGVGYVHNIVRKSDGTLLSWGNNFYGQLGRSTPQANDALAAPVVINGVAFSNVQNIAVGTGHNLVIRTDGSIWSWGYNEYGNLGLGRDAFGVSQITPQRIPNLGAARAIAAGYAHSIAIARRTVGSALVVQTSTEFKSGASWASSNSITLTFSSKLKSIAPGGVRVLINDKEVEVQSTSISSTTLNVLLPAGTLQKGDEIIAAWSGLQTESGEMLQGNSPVIIAE